MKGKDETGLNVADAEFQTLRQALRQMPSPEPRAGFVERALARAVAQSRSGQRAASLRVWGHASADREPAAGRVHADARGPPG